MKEDPRTKRLRADHQHLMELKGRSDFIDFEVIEPTPGLPPEKYVITFSCRGIVGIDDRKRPIYSELHQVAVILDLSYPAKAPPKMRWITPIWHPNIEHKEPFRVCIDSTWWAPGRTLDSIILMLGEMIQYKNYHALLSPPYPADKEVATWVLWAESEGILSHSKPVDTRELLRPQRVKSPTTTEVKTSRIGIKVITEPEKKVITEPEKKGPRVKIVE